MEGAPGRRQRAWAASASRSSTARPASWSTPLDLAAFADAVAGLLGDPRRALALGVRAREQVREQFLGPRHLRQYVDLFEQLLQYGAT